MYTHNQNQYTLHQGRNIYHKICIETLLMCTQTLVIRILTLVICIEILVMGTQTLVIRTLTLIIGIETLMMGLLTLVIGKQTLVICTLILV